MKRFFIIVCLLGLAWLSLADHTWAASGKKGSFFSRSTISKTYSSIKTGTQKVVSGTIDVVTLKKFRKKKTLSEPAKPWLNNTTAKKKKKEEKKSFWSALLPSKKEEKSNKVRTMKDFVGLDRPS